jgi:hypothetical protein
VRRIGLSTLRALWWAETTAHQVRRDLASGGLDDLVVTFPPPLPQRDRRWVAALFRIRRQTCLVRSAVLQAWDAAHGRPRDLVIGVTAPSAGFKAHAWLEGDSARSSGGFSEISRRPPPTAPAGGTRGPGSRGPATTADGSGGDGLAQAVDQPREVGPVP